MKKIGLFYVTSAVKTGQVAEKVQKAFGKENIDILAIEDVLEQDFEKYDNIILGAATWFDGELPTHWDEALPELSGVKLKGKKVAIFGLGNQVHYPENFVDSIGILAEIVEQTEAKLVGFTSPEGYTFERSRALKDGKLLGLAIDKENQLDKTDKRIKDWVEQLKKEFN